MSKYAQGTSVPPEKSQMQITKLLRTYKASGVMIGFDGGNSFIAFIYNNIQVRMFCPIAKSDAEERRRWRVMRIIIQSKFEMIQCGIRSFEEEFFADIVMPNGKTVSQIAIAAVKKAISSGEMPVKLLGV
jgi:hypothetical protein